MSVEKLEDSSKVLSENFPFTQVLNDVITKIKDNDSFRLYCFLLSKPRNWKVVKKYSSKECGVGETKSKKCWSYLKRCNLMGYKIIKDKKGRIIRYDVIVFNGLNFNENEPFTEHPTQKESSGAEIHPVEKRPLLNKEVINKDIKTNTNTMESRGDRESLREKEESEKHSDHKKRGRPTKNRTFIDPMFLPNEQHRDIALESKVSVEQERRKFINHYQSHGKMMKDWDAAFRNWLIKAGEYRVVRKKTNTEIMEEVMEEMRREQKKSNPSGKIEHFF